MKWKKEMEMEVVSILIWFDFISYPRNIQPIKFRNLLDKNLYFNWSYFLISVFYGGDETFGAIKLNINACIERMWVCLRVKFAFNSVFSCSFLDSITISVFLEFDFALICCGWMRVMGDRENTKNARWKLSLGLRAKVVDVRPTESQMRHLYFIPYACVLACKC